MEAASRLSQGRASQWTATPARGPRASGRHHDLTAATRGLSAGDAMHERKSQSARRRLTATQERVLLHTYPGVLPHWEGARACRKRALAFPAASYIINRTYGRLGQASLGIATVTRLCAPVYRQGQILPQGKPADFFDNTRSNRTLSPPTQVVNGLIIPRVELIGMNRTVRIHDRPPRSLELWPPSALGHGDRVCGRQGRRRGRCRGVAEQALHLAVVLRRPGERLHDVVHGAQRRAALPG